MAVQTLSPHFIALGRVIVALVWLYQGLWLKVIAVDPHHLEIVTQVGFASPLMALRLIGAGETLLALGVLSGLFYRWISLFQILLLVAMNASGILFGGGKIAQPVGLIIGNLPLLFCIALVGLHGPGSYALRTR
jgi:uncharacterized membrane protein YphA (DoxX/SURF4 family)